MNKCCNRFWFLNYVVIATDYFVKFNNKIGTATTPKQQTHIHISLSMRLHTHLSTRLHTPVYEITCSYTHLSMRSPIHTHICLRDHLFTHTHRHTPVYEITYPHTLVYKITYAYTPVYEIIDDTRWRYGKQEAPCCKG